MRSHPQELRDLALQHRWPLRCILKHRRKAVISERTIGPRTRSYGARILNRAMLNTAEK